MAKFKIIRPTATDGHAVEVLESRKLLEEWVEGIDFTRLESGPNRGGGMLVAVEDEIVNSATEFWKQIDALVEDNEDREIEIRQIPRLVGG